MYIYNIPFDTAVLLAAAPIHMCTEAKENEIQTTEYRHLTKLKK